MIVLLLSPLPPPSGGISTWTRNILNYSVDNVNGYEIIHQDTASRLKKILKVDILNRCYYGCAEFLRVRRQLKENIARNKPDVIHITSSGSLALLKDYSILRIAKQHRIPVILHWRFGRIPDLAIKKNWEWFLLKKVIRKSYGSIVIDNKSFNCLKKEGLNNTVEIPNPAGEDIVMNNLKDSKPGIRKKDGSIIYAGHVFKDKGIYELVEACSYLIQVKELIIAGTYEEKTRIELLKIARKRDNAKWFRMTGEIDKNVVLTLIKSSMLLVLPSYSEGFPNVVLEAMSMGCAVVATDVGAVPEMLAVSSDKPCGICVPVKNTEKLRDAILSLLDDPKKAEWMGKNGRERVLEKYTLKRVMLQYESLWQKAISN